MKKVTKETHLQLFLIIFLLALGILLLPGQLQFLRGTKPLAQNPTVHFSPRPMTQQGKDTLAKITKTDKYIGDLKLVDEEDFKIEYLISNELFMVTIKKEPYAVVKVHTQDWFVKQGFVDFDLCLLKVDFVSVKGVGDNLTAKDSVFDRCPVPDTKGATPSANLSS